MQTDNSPRKILRYITLVICRRRVLICSIFLLTLLSFAFGTFLITPQWEATTKLLVLENPKQQMILFNDLAAPSPPEKESANDLIQILTSKSFGSEIVKRYALDEIKRGKAQNPKKLRDKMKLFLVRILRSPLTLATKLGLRKEKSPNFFADALEELIEDMEDIELEDGTSTINLSIWAETSELAMGIANTLSSMLVEKTREFERSEASDTYDFVKTHLQSINAALNKAEDELSNFKQQENFIDLEEEKSLNAQKFYELTEQHETNKKSLIAANAKLKELNNQFSTQNAHNEIYQDLEKEIINTKTTIAELQANITFLQNAIVQVKEKISTLPSLEVTFERLSRSVNNLKDRYINLNQKLLELEVQKFTQISQFDVKISDSAFIPEGTDPNWPIWWLNLAVGMIAGLFLSLGLAFLLEYWSDTLRIPMQMSTELGLKLMGAVPQFKVKKVLGQINGWSTQKANSYDRLDNETYRIK